MDQSAFHRAKGGEPQHRAKSISISDYIKENFPSGGFWASKKPRRYDTMPRLFFAGIQREVRENLFPLLFLGCPFPIAPILSAS